LLNGRFFNFNQILQMVRGTFFHHLPAHGEGKKSEQTIGDEKENKKKEHEFQTQASKNHLYALLPDETQENSVSLMVRDIAATVVVSDSVSCLIYSAIILQTSSRESGNAQ
jgi:hypothetical protein